MQDIPMRDLKNTEDIERKYKEEAHIINRGISDYEQGKVTDGKSLLKKLRKKYGI